MKYSFINQENEKIIYDSKYILIFEEDIKNNKPIYPVLKEIDDNTNGLISNFIKKEKITGKENSIFSFYFNEKRIIIAGLGNKDCLTPRIIKSISGKICKNAINEKDNKILIAMRTNDTLHYTRFVEESETTAYCFIDCFSEEKQTEKKIKLNEIIFLTNEGKELKNAIKTGKIIGDARNFARNLINYPSNYLNPEKLGKIIKNKFTAIEVKVYEKDEIKKLKMGGLLGVNQGSKDEPRFIIIKYIPEKNKNNIKLALVGKGITFDTGGISIKPAQDMHEMKGDMAGAATVCAVIDVISSLGLPIEVVSIIPSTPNMPDGKAMNPGDVLTAFNGKTVEVLNTDAEGRLILMDALSYAVEKENVTHIIDIATLTGAISIALGDITTGLFSNNDELADRILKAGNIAGEYLWRLPMFKEYSKQLESKIADLKNIGGRKAGSITAAKFLEEFVDDKPWVHLDIAGTSYRDDHEYLAPSATGEIISTLCEMIIELSK